jgi:hypothetical protein|tara:strand:+ start:850 stop:1170 length:321 start_codon:yes stop_codon:yes gene_type:complete
MTNKTVYIVNDSGHDFSSAEPFGELVFLTKGLVDRFNLTGMYRAFQSSIDESHPEDFILHSGPGVMSAVACSMFSAKHGRLNLLLWRGEENGKQRYVQRRLSFNKD